MFSQFIRQAGFWLATIAFVCTAAGCATTTASRPQPEAEQARQLPVPEAPRQQGRPKSGARLAEDVLFKALMGEIAGQRGHLDIAVQNYLELAREIPDARVAERATQIAIFAQKDREALQAARLWVKYAPDSLEARQVLAATYIRNGKAQQALEQLEHVLAVHPGNEGQKLRMVAGFLSREQDRATALAVMEQLIAKRQDDADALFAYAILAIRAEQTEKAREAMERVMALKPDDTNVVMAYLGILQKQNDLDTALSWLRQTLDRKPDARELRMAYARLLADAKQFDKAREQFEILAASDPDDTDVQYALGLLNVQTEKLQQAKENFSALVEAGHKVDEASFYLGYIAENERDYVTAAKWYGAVNSGDLHFESQLKVALMLARQGKLPQARNHLASIRANDPGQRKQLVMAEAELLTEQKQYRQAMALYDRAIGKGHDTDLLYSRAMLAEKMGKLDLLERDLRQILAQEPDNAQALNALGYTLADRTDRYQEAYELIKKALEVNPNDFYILDSMGWVLYRLGKFEEAVSYLRRALAIRDDPEVAAHLGEVLWVMGDKKKARTVWNNALKNSPDDEKILEAIRRLAP